MYRRYPREFIGPSLPGRPRRGPVWAGPGYDRPGQNRPDDFSPRPERATPPTRQGDPSPKLEELFEQPVEEAPDRSEPAGVERSVQAPPVDEVDWKTKAFELQAEMDNFRKRQKRRADEAIAAERARLLAHFLPVADNLSRALAHEGEADGNLYQGVALTHRELMRLLEAEGVSRLETVGRPFDPNLHEALATTPADVESNTIVEEVEAGYTIGDKLLRPAKVVVAA